MVCVQHLWHSHFNYLVACILCHLLLSIWKSGYSTLVDPEPKSQRRATLPRRISTARKSVWKTAEPILIHSIKCVFSPVTWTKSFQIHIFACLEIYTPGCMWSDLPVCEKVLSHDSVPQGGNSCAFIGIILGTKRRAIDSEPSHSFSSGWRHHAHEGQPQKS